MQRLHIIVLCDFVSPIISASKAQPSQHRPLGRATITHKTTLISTVCRISFSIICFWLPLRFYFIWRVALLWLPRHCPTQASAPRCAPAQPHDDCIPTNCCGQQLYSVASLCLMLIIHTASQNVAPVHQASCKRQVAWNEEAKQQYGRSIFFSSISQLWTLPPLPKSNRAGNFRHQACLISTKKGQKTHTEASCIRFSYQLLTAISKHKFR